MVSSSPRKRGLRPEGPFAAKPIVQCVHRRRRGSGLRMQHAQSTGAATQRTPPASSKKHLLTALSRERSRAQQPMQREAAMAHAACGTPIVRRESGAR
eukprot:3380684-Alexandrium_andersonii.AAC.1